MKGGVIMLYIKPRVFVENIIADTTIASGACTCWVTTYSSNSSIGNGTDGGLVSQTGSGTVDDPLWVTMCDGSFDNIGGTPDVLTKETYCP